MRRAFIIGAKLLGLLALYWTASSMAQAGFSLTGYLASRNPPALLGPWWITGLVADVLLSLGLALMLLFRTERLADALRVRDDGPWPDPGSADRLLRAGMLLLGVYFLVLTLPALAATLVAVAQVKNGFRSPLHLARLIEPVLKMALAAAVVSRPEKVIEFLSRRGPRDGAGG